MLEFKNCNILNMNQSNIYHRGKTASGRVRFKKETTRPRKNKIASNDIRMSVDVGRVGFILLTVQFCGSIPYISSLVNF